MTLTAVVGQVCTICREDLPVERFDRDGTRLRRQCKDCRSAKMKAWYQDNRARQAGRQRDRRQHDPDRVRQIDRDRYQRDRDKRMALVQASVWRRRAERAGVEIDDSITYAALRQRFGDRCCYCQAVMSFATIDGHVFVPLKATIEHMTPLSRGGSHTWDNVRLACWGCNVAKNDTELDAWLASTR